MADRHHDIVIVGGGTAGITVAALLKKKNVEDVAVIEPSDKHYYQPLWTLVGGGVVDRDETVRSEAKVMPKGVSWIREAATGFDPDNNVVKTENMEVSYNTLVVCPGIQLDWGKIEGVTETLGYDGVSSNYTFDLAPKTWDFIKNTTSGSAVFTMPAGPIKCAGAPQKIAYLACDYWRSEGVLSNIDVHLVIPSPRIFGIDEISDQLDMVIADYGINLHPLHNLEKVDSSNKKAHFASMGDGEGLVLDYDMMHVTPPQSAPDWVKESPLATDQPTGYVDIDKHTMQHVRYPNIFSLGDAGSSPNSKTGAAIRKQAPVVVGNIMNQRSAKNLTENYEGYASCPLTTSRSKMLLAEFDYSMERTPTLPVDTLKPRTDMWYLKRYGLPFMYWNGMLKGRDFEVPSALLKR